MSTEKNEGKELIEGLIKDQVSTRAMQKLNRKPLYVSVCRHAFALDTLESELAFLTDAIKDANSEDDKKKVTDRIETIKSEIAKLEKDVIEGVLTPLTYRDIGDIKAAVTEAVVHFQSYKFDPEVIVSRIVAEEKFMTIFCALKRKDNANIRYFESLDEIAQLEDLTVFDLHRRWEEHFVLTDEELKN